MSVYDGNINDLGNDTQDADAAKAKALLSKLDPMDPQDAEDGRRVMAALKKAIDEEKDPQDVEDGKRFLALLHRLFGGSDAAPEAPAAPAPVADATGVVDTSVLTGSRDGLKNFLIKKSRDKDMPL